jgi:hypothetical protein
LAAEHIDSMTAHDRINQSKLDCKVLAQRSDVYAGSVGRGIT